MHFIRNDISTAWSALPPVGKTPKPQAHSAAVFAAVRSGDVERVASLLHAYDVDLSAIDEGTGETALHRAVTAGSVEIVTMLLARVHDHPCVLHAPDRAGYTPLMCAAMTRDVPIMKRLVDAGAGLGNLADLANQLNSDADAKRSFEHCLSIVLALTQAGGDLSKAVDVALDQGLESSARCLFEALDDPRCLFTEYIRAGQFDRVAIMVGRGWIKDTDLIDSIDEAIRSGNEPFIQCVTDYCAADYERSLMLHYALDGDVRGVSIIVGDGPPAAHALQTISMMKDRSREERLTAMKMITGAMPPGFVPNMPGAADRNDMEGLILLLESGVVLSSVNLHRALAMAAEQQDRAAMKVLQGYGANALDVLRVAAHEHTWVAGLASSAIEFSVLDNPSITDRATHLAMLKACLGSSPKMESGAMSLMLEEAKARRFDRVALLMEANVPTAYLLIDLIKENHRDIARKMIAMKADVASAVSTLQESMQAHAVVGDREKARNDQDVINGLMLEMTLVAQAENWTNQTPAGPAT